MLLLLLRQAWLPRHVLRLIHRHGIIHPCADVKATAPRSLIPEPALSRTALLLLLRRLRLHSRLCTPFGHCTPLPLLWLLLLLGLPFPAPAGRSLIGR